MLYTDGAHPAFVFSTFVTDGDLDCGGDVDIVTHMPKNLSETAPASNALLYGLAVLMLDATGAIDDTILKIIDKGVPSEVEVSRQIDLMLQEVNNVNTH